MHCKLSLSLLLASVFALSFQDVEALPTVKRNVGMVTLPLKRVQQRSDIHPQIRLQQNINRSHKRLARMTGRAPPTQQELRDNLHKRILVVEGPEGLAKRYNRQGVPSKVKASHKSTSNLELVGGQDKNRGKKGSGGAVTAGAAAAAAKGKGSGNDGNGSAAAASGPGVSPLDIAAIQNPSVTDANAPSTGDSLGLDIEANDAGYLATVQMGTPPQDFLILMDSGSADLWVGSENCSSQAGGGCGNHKFLGSQSSSTFVDTQKPFAVTYGSGNVAGDIITDTLTVAGLTLNAHTFGVATSESDDFSANTVPFDGLMGLAQSSLSQQNTPTPIESLASNGLVTDAITSYKISRLADAKNDGEITFGGLDTSKFDPTTLETVDNVSQSGFWEASMPAVSVGGTDLGLQGRTAILDTGTTLIVAPPDDAATVHQSIPGAKSDGQGGFTVPCTTTASVALTFGSTSFAIDPRDLADQPVDINDPTGDCTSGISSGSVGGATEWLVGDVFLKNAYFSTDVGKNTISLAKLV